MELVQAVGGVLFAFLFIGSGIGHFKAVDAMVGYAQYKKLPLAKPAVLLSGAIFLLGGLAVLAGSVVSSVATYGGYGALAIAITLFPTAIIFHNFWTIEDAQTKQTEQIAFNKDLALAGAALFIAAALLA